MSPTLHRPVPGRWGTDQHGGDENSFENAPAKRFLHTGLPTADRVWGTLLYQLMWVLDG